MLLTSRKVQTLTQELQGHAAAVSTDVPCNTCDGENTCCEASDTEEQELQVLNVTCFTRTKVVVPLQHMQWGEHFLCGFRAARDGEQELQALTVLLALLVQKYTDASVAAGAFVGGARQAFFFVTCFTI